MKRIISFTADRQLGVIVNSLNLICSSDYLEFLVQYASKDTILVLNSLDHDVAAICGMTLSQREIEKLAKYESVSINQYRLTYFSDKLFIIRKGYGQNEIEAVFSDLSQYDKSFNEVKKDKTIEDLKLETLKGLEYATKVYSSFVELGLEPETLISPANVFQHSKIFMGQNFPKRSCIPFEASDLAYKCAYGNWTECYTRGHWDEVYDMDLNSAYSAIASDLLDLRLGHWIHDNNYHPEATYGYMEVEASMDSQLHPIFMKTPDMNYSPTDVFMTYINKSKYDLIEKYQLGFVTIVNAWWFIYDHKQRITPLKGLINWLFAQKQKRTGLSREIVKRIINGGVYGKFLEYREKENGDSHYGDLFLSPWGAEIQCGCQVKVAEACLQNGINPIHIAVDGILTEKPIPTPNPDKLGEWRISYQGKALVAGTGLVAIENKVGEGDFSISYDWIMAQIRNNPEAREYIMQRMNVLSVKQSSERNELEKCGMIVDENRVVEVCRENKRNYSKSPNCAADLLSHKYYSRAWDSSVIEIMTEDLEKN